MPSDSGTGIGTIGFGSTAASTRANTDLVATERNRTAATRTEAEGAGAGDEAGARHELKLQVQPFSDAAREFLTWARRRVYEPSGHGEAACTRAS